MSSTTRSRAQRSGQPSHHHTQQQERQNLLHELRQLQSTGGRLPLFGSLLANAIESLRANRARSLLATLGIFIGVAAVVTSVILSQSDGAYITQQITSQGLNTVIVFPATPPNAVTVGSGSPLTLRDVRSLAQVPHVLAFSPFITTSDQVIYNNQHWSTTIEGVGVDVRTIQNWQLAQGAWFSQADDDNGITAAVLGDTVAHALSPGSASALIGQQIRIRNQDFHVVGVLSPKGGTANQDDMVFIPFKTAQIRLKNTNTVDQVQMLADTTNDVDQVSQAATTILRKNHYIRTNNGTADDFTINTFTQAIQQMQITTLLLSISILTIAALSLGVGGIGIMNVMLVSVTERRREIGILTALGARRIDILSHFLIESLILCLLGGLIGLLLGVLIGWVMARLLGYPFIMTAATLLVPFTVSTAVALIFGIYPAIRAARLEPVVAIRSE